MNKNAQKFFVLLSLLILILMINIPSSFSESESNEIIWLDYEEGIEKARLENKTVLIDFYTDWCTYCTEMDEDTYSKSSIIEKTEQFVCIKVDGDARSDLVGKYDIDGYPTTLFLSPNGTEVHRVVGYSGPNDFMGHMQFALGEKEKAPGSSAPPCANIFLVSLIGLVVIARAVIVKKKK
jgi:thiol:disulfide interchange protein DsbD